MLLSRVKKGIGLFLFPGSLRNYLSKSLLSSLFQRKEECPTLAKRGRGYFHNDVYGNLRPLYYVIEIAGAVNDTMDFHRFAADDIECKVGFDDKNAIAGILELFVAGNAAEKRVGLKVAEVLVDFINKDRGIRRTVIRDPDVVRHRDRRGAAVS